MTNLRLSLSNTKIQTLRLYFLKIDPKYFLILNVKIFKKDPYITSCSKLYLAYGLKHMVERTVFTKTS